MPSALILIANGTEEMEFTIPFDTLVRAGVTCVSALVDSAGSSLTAICSRGIKIQADYKFSVNPWFHPDISQESFDALIIPGGAQGAETISKSAEVQDLVRDFIEHDKIVGMICAGSLTALTSNLPKQPLTSHPSVKSFLENRFIYSEESVVVSGKLVTSRGPGTAFPFALTLVELLCGAQKRAEVHAPMVFPPGSGF